MELPGHVPFRVRPAFFIVVALLGAGRVQLWPLLGWVGVCLVSVVVHECGHAYVAMAFGYAPSVELWGGGGLTHFARPGERVPALTDSLVSLAGPAAGFVFGGLSVLLSHAFPPVGDPRLALLYSDLWWVNIGWGAVNLVPVIPLDGSHLALRALEWLRPATAGRDLEIVSIGLCTAGGAVAVFWFKWPFAALYAAWLALPSFRGLFQRRRQVQALSVRSQIVAALAGGDGEKARQLGEAERRRTGDSTGVVLALVGLGRFEELGVLLEATPAGHPRDPILEGLYRLAVENDLEAAKAVVDADFPSWLAVEALIALQRSGKLEAAAALWHAQREVMEESGLALLAVRAFYAGFYELSQAASELRFQRTGAAESAYNVACCCARRGRVEEGVDWLTKALQAGFADRALVAKDPDLDPLRASPRFPVAAIGT
jgi:Zn-dependent protease